MITSNLAENDYYAKTNRRTKEIKAHACCDYTNKKETKKSNPVLFTYMSCKTKQNKTKQKKKKPPKLLSLPSLLNLRILDFGGCFFLLFSLLNFNHFPKISPPRIFLPCLYKKKKKKKKKVKKSTQEVHHSPYKYNLPEDPKHLLN